MHTKGPGFAPGPFGVSPGCIPQWGRFGRAAGGDARGLHTLVTGTPPGARKGVFVARLTARSTWFSWLVGLFCFAVVGGLVVMAAPMGPAVADWMRSTVTTLTAQGTGSGPAGEALAPFTASEAGGLPATCAALSSPALTAALDAAGAGAPTGDVGEAPAGTVGVAELLGAQAVIDCRWGAESGTAHAWVATVGGDAASTAEELLRASGFECETDGDAVRCVRVLSGDAGAAASTETHVVRGDLWMVATSTGWDADQFAGALEATVWPAA